MTAVVGLVERDPRRGRRVWLGGDSVAGNVEDYSARVVGPKVFRNSGCLLGYTTSFRMGQILQYQAKLPSWSGEDPVEFAVRKLVPAIVESFQQNQWLAKNSERIDGGTFLVGVGGHLVQINQDFCVTQVRDFDFSAIGSGFSYSLGSMHASEGAEPGKRIRLALGAAAAFSAYVRPPWHVLRSGWFK